MTRLSDHIRDLIKESGPISMAHFMELCLTHPKWGYYTGRDPLGRSGDFTTAPEVSQMFGELVGLFLADYWVTLGQPKPAQLIELGPGRGTLMADALRAMKVVPGMAETMHVNFIEVSPALKAKQKKSVPGAAWFETLEDIPFGCSLIIANEFFDCLPVRQFIMTETGWAERMVGLEDENLGIILSDKNLPSFLPAGAEVGDIKETAPQAGYWIDALASRLLNGGGMAVIIDYGYNRPGFGDTVQAICGHEYIGIFEKPGESDITAHVNFPSLAARAGQAGLAAFGPMNQGDFLEMVGVEHRAAQLLKTASKKQQDDILAAVKRLVDPGEMGSLFKVLVLTPKDARPPAGMT